MKDFMLLFRGGDGRKLDSPDEVQAHMQKWMVWVKDLNEKGHHAGGHPLLDNGKTISGTKNIVSDGPFTEGKEIVGGYLLIKAESLEQATELSKGCPTLDFEDGIVEIRPIQNNGM